MKISFLVPAYNNEVYIRKSIESILKQNAEYAKEIIVVNDGSEDNTHKILKELLKEISELKVIHKINGGESSALNEGLKHCCGDYIAIVEADTMLKEDWLSHVLSGFDSEDVMGVGGTLAAAREDSWIARLAAYEVEEKYRTKPKSCQHITSANAIYRKEAFERFGKFNENLINASLDSDFNSRIVSDNYKLIYIKEAIANHHFKPTFIEYLKRQYAYAFYRMHVRQLILYPADKWLSVNVAFCSLAFISLALIPFYPIVPAGMFVAAFLLQIPTTYRLWKVKRDSALLVYPPVVIVRNILGAIGYAAGLFAKEMRRNKSKR
jgi:cellulose synthase/poly-beta-1,6-N-acetylglucosamine synthase-like glycosyltransferase